MQQQKCITYRYLEKYCPPSIGSALNFPLPHPSVRPALPPAGSDAPFLPPQLLKQPLLIFMTQHHDHDNKQNDNNR